MATRSTIIYLNTKILYCKQRNSNLSHFATYQQKHLNDKKEAPMLSRLKIGPSFRYSRGIVSALTGIIFTLNDIFKMPASGKSPAITVGIAGLSIMAFKSREYYVKSEQDISITEYRDNMIQSSTARIASEISQYPDQLLKLQSSQKDIANEEPSTHPTDEQLNRLLKNILNEELNHPHRWETILGKYSHCTLAFFSQACSHLMECILLKTYDDTALFELNGFTADNLIIATLSLLSLYNGYQIFQENRIEYDKKHIDQACENVQRRLHQ
jgi:hypothetical protein